MKKRSIKEVVFVVAVALTAILVGAGCSTTKEIVYKRIDFSDTNGVTTIYYPLSMEKDMIHPHQDKRWKYIVSEDASDDGKAKLMVAKP